MVPRGYTLDPTSRWGLPRVQRAAASILLIPTGDKKRAAL